MAAVLLSPAAWSQKSSDTPATHVHYTSSPEAAKPAPSGTLAPRLQNLGRYKVSWFTCQPAVHPWLNQGLNLAYAFNHVEAARAFREAARLDANCAMAYWGEALVLGPNINAPMNAADEPRAHELVQKALALKSSPRERAYIEALARRYTGKSEDRAAADNAFAAAMREVARMYPRDLDAATLFAESLMDLMPWNYWTRDYRPSPGTDEVTAALQRVLQANPNHPGALHYWIHLWEMPAPEKALAEADRLVPLVPGAGHMVHMPAHIYFRVGRYEDVVRVNEMAVLADEDYIAQCRAQGLYPLGYYPHNIYFIWFGATALGDSRKAIESARKVVSKLPVEEMNKDASLAFLQTALMVPTYALVRFGKWADILKEPAPGYRGAFAMGIYHYARALAYIAKAQWAEAEGELSALRAYEKQLTLKEGPASFSQNTDYKILRIAPEVVAGEMAAKRGDFDKAIAHLQRAVHYEDALHYTEPYDWHFPVRHNLGAVLLQAGRATEAEVVYWQDLRINPENGWSLFGLAEALKAQGNHEEAARIAQRFKKAWSKADVTLAASRF
jgi:tetratricopeptide (TPR) repeat protein